MPKGPPQGPQSTTIWRSPQNSSHRGQVIPGKSISRDLTMHLSIQEYFSFPTMENAWSELNDEEKRDDGNEMRLGDQLVWEWWWSKVPSVLLYYHPCMICSSHTDPSSTSLYKVCCTAWVWCRAVLSCLVGSRLGGKALIRPKLTLIRWLLTALAQLQNIQEKLMNKTHHVSR